MQVHVAQHDADRTALCGSLLVWIDLAVFQDARDIRAGGGNGSIIGRNAFQRSREEALQMLDRLVRIYKGEE